MAVVQNLKAIFERSNESISPDRGRSGASSASGIETPTRPLSKIRTSFVSVERIGNRSISKERRILIRSSSTNECENPNFLDIYNNNKKITTGESNLNFKSSIGQRNAASIMKDEEKQIDLKRANDSSVISISKDSNKINAIQGDKISKLNASPLSLKNTTLSNSSKGASQRNPATPTSRNIDIRGNEVKSIQKSTNSKTGSYSSIRSKPENTPAHSKNHNQETSQLVRVKRLTPKSPTRPVKLPPSLTTHTASSSSKTANAVSSTFSQPSLRRVSSNFQQSISSQRRMSIASNISLMPKYQVKKNHSDSRTHLDSSKKTLTQSTLPQSATTELSFLARMTRPTASSSSKTTDKLPTSKKNSMNTRPTTKNASKTTSHKSEPKKNTSAMKRDKKPDIPTAKNINVSTSKMSKKKTLQSTSNSTTAEHKNKSSSSKIALNDKESGDPFTSFEPNGCNNKMDDEKSLDVPVNQPKESPKKSVQEFLTNTSSLNTDPIDDFKEAIVFKGNVSGTEAENPTSLGESDLDLSNCKEAIVFKSNVSGTEAENPTSLGESDLDLSNCKEAIVFKSNVSGTEAENPTSLGENDLDSFNCKEAGEMEDQNSGDSTVNKTLLDYEKV
ncbi:hypothetical protein EV44_g4805 [Erysiphe necator]|uniref:Uncharacterized protein n=1 Tax=Uncinula necator TaxID=52586 RepID=A0A0B1P7A0_UNCNE|nr:hypothetical protein EV44_g4805 [Erysiphe necator]